MKDDPSDEYYEEIRKQTHKRLREGTGELPEPWRRIHTPAVEGLFAVGLDPSGAYLLTISPAGRELFDCATGELVAWERSEDPTVWMSFTELWARGIGPIDGQRVTVAGICGGGLTTTTADGWCVGMSAVDWPRTHVWVEPPGSRGFYAGGRFYRLYSWDRPLAHGFSVSGRTLLVACRDEICVWHRAEDAAGG